MKNNTYDARTIFRQLGANRMEVDLAVQHAFRKPITSIPTDVTTKVIVKSLQQGARQAGCSLRADGLVGPDTAACFARISGAEWRRKNWLHIGSDIIHMRDSGQQRSPVISDLPGLGDASIVGQAGGLLLIGAVVFLALKFKR